MTGKMMILLTALALIANGCRQADADFSWKDASVFAYPIWKGEKTGAIASISSNDDLKNVRVKVSGFRSGNSSIPASAAQVFFIREVMADTFQEGYGQCGNRRKEDFDSLLVADMLDPAPSVDIPSGHNQQIWMSIRIPSDTEPGTYSGKMTLISDKGRKNIPVEFKVAPYTLPEPSEWAFHLDLWQNPYAVARYHGVEPWSSEHFRHMEPVMKILADAGQKVITATILDRPWNGQTEDPFGSMVTKTLRKDGTWKYDYEVFDRWVEFMTGLGIDRQINCYSMIPWKLEFDYFDEASGETRYIRCAPSSNEYRLYWGNFISDFAAHLREKGWFGKTVIAMDERSEEDMKIVMQLIHGVEPDFKVSLAGNGHPSLEEHLYDYCLAFRQAFPQEVLRKRKEEGKISTFYTCCAERYPNTFLISPQSEASWIPWHAFAKGYDGYLRWAYNSWTEDPVKDARFRSWPAGDCFIVYPDGRSSVRMERLLEGIQDYEKARLSMQRWETEGDTASISRMKKALERFNFADLTDNGAEDAIKEAKSALAGI